MHVPLQEFSELDLLQLDLLVLLRNYGLFLFVFLFQIVNFLLKLALVVGMFLMEGLFCVAHYFDLVFKRSNHFLAFSISDDGWGSGQD